MKLFVLNRTEDETGVSGTGIVAEGVQFTNGKCALSWLSEHTSVALYDDIAVLEAIHGHDGKTVVEWTVQPNSKPETDSRMDANHPGWAIAGMVIIAMLGFLLISMLGPIIFP